MEKQNIKNYQEYSEERLTKRVIFKENKTAIFLLNFTPGQTLPKHKHPGSNLQLIVLEGKGEFDIDGQIVPVQKDDILFVNGEEELSFTNNGASNVSLCVTLFKIPDENYAKDI